MLQGKYPLLIALVLGVMAGTIAYSAQHKWIVDQRLIWAPTRILCAAQDLDEGAELDETMIDVCEMPARYMTDSILRVPNDNEPDAPVPYGQKLLVPLKKGDAFMYSQFQVAVTMPLSVALPRWARAVTLEVSEKAAVGRHLQPNDHVDVLATLRDPEGKEPITITLLMNEIVMATGGATGQTAVRSDEDRRYTHVTLMVAPREAEMLTLAQEIGSVSLVMRHPDAEQESKDWGTVTTFKTLLTEEKTLYGARLPRQTMPTTGTWVCHGNDCRYEPPTPDVSGRKSPL